MPVIFLKYKPDRVPREVMCKLSAELPEIIARALDVPEDANKRLTPKDIQIWALPANEFDMNIKDLQFMIPLHHYEERIGNLEGRKDLIIKEIRNVLAKSLILAASGSKMTGWVWILPSSDTAFGRI